MNDAVGFLALRRASGSSVHGWTTTSGAQAAMTDPGSSSSVVKPLT